ncbi:MAG TPA: NUDIX domain-containing protein [Candidatus Paceibacterota bacterium]|nr:NUDIX domain-containing protein [Candidatus Paceibacterota bacterium]
MAGREKNTAVVKERSAGAIIFRKEIFLEKKDKIYYLLLHYPSGHWDFVKGHIEKGESERETAKREIKEETGIKDVKFIPGFIEKINYFFYRNLNDQKDPPLSFNQNNKVLVLKEVVFYLAETKEKNVEISFEHIGYEWLEYKEAIKKVTFKNAREVLKKANEFLKSYLS